MTYRTSPVGHLCIHTGHYTLLLLHLSHHLGQRGLGLGQFGLEGVRSVSNEVVGDSVVVNELVILYR